MCGHSRSWIEIKTAQPIINYGEFKKKLTLVTTYIYVLMPYYNPAMFSTFRYVHQLRSLTTFHKTICIRSEAITISEATFFFFFLQNKPRLMGKFGLLSYHTTLLLLF